MYVCIVRVNVYAYITRVNVSPVSGHVLLYLTCVKVCLSLLYLICVKVCLSLLYLICVKVCLSLLYLPVSKYVYLYLTTCLKVCLSLLYLTCVSLSVFTSPVSRYVFVYLTCVKVYLCLPPLCQDIHLPVWLSQRHDQSRCQPCCRCRGRS